MRELLFRWLKLDAQNFIHEVWWAVVVIWVLLLLFSISSIRSQTITGSSKIAWTLIVVAVPFLGLFAYCIFCLARVDYHMFEFLLFRKRKKA